MNKQFMQAWINNSCVYMLIFLIFFVSPVFAKNQWFADQQKSDSTGQVNSVVDRKPLCGIKKVQEICAIANAASASVFVNCSIDFIALDCQTAANTKNIITKKLLFHGQAASGVVANFNGAHIDAGPDQYNYQQQDIIEVSSIPSTNGTWSVPRNISISNVRINGSVRVMGMGRNGEADAVRASSHQAGHSQRVRANAPSGISLNNITLQADKRTPLYFAPGVSNSQLQNSSISGVSTRVAIYLDTETRGIELSNNVFDVQTSDGSYLGFYDRGWPQLALDGSSHNRIIGNRFARVDNGGVYLYRNCGEGGTVRYSTPSENVIEGNRFERRTADRGSSPAIFIGSRNYGWLENNLPGSHCSDDQLSGVKQGSAVSNADHAQRNRIINNQFQRVNNAGKGQRWVRVGTHIKIGNPRFDRGNTIQGNRWFDKH